MRRKNYIKVADDTTFEQNFFQLAFTYIRDKIPNLLDYMLGFEVVNKNDEGTQAVGLFKFDVGGRQLFVPVFYKNGELKGADLLYNQGQDRFVPNKENWVDTLLNARPEELGAASEMSRGDIMSNSQSGGADLSKIFNPTMNTKLSMDKMQDLNDSFDWSLPTFLKQADCSFSELYTRTLMANPELHKLAAEAYGPELYEALQSCKESDVNPDVDQKIVAGAKVLQLDNEKAPDVEVIDSCCPQPVLDSLSTKEKKELIEEGVVLKDNRKDGARIPYKIQGPMRLNASNGAGAYDVLFKGGKFVRSVLLPAISACDNTQILFPLEGKGDPAGVESTKVFASRFEDSDKEFKNFVDSLKDATSAKGYTYSPGMYDKEVQHNVFVEADGSQAAGPFALETSLDYEGSKTFAVHGGGMDIRKVVISSAYRRMRVVDGTLYVPDAAKTMQFSAKQYSCKKPDLGDARDIDAKIKGLFDEVKVAKDRSGFRVTVNGAPVFKEASKRDVYVGLVAGLGMSISDAKQALKSAAALETATYTFEKQSAPSFAPGMISTPDIPPVPTGMNPTLGVTEQYPQAQTMSASSGQPGNILNQNIMNSLTGMAQTKPALNQASVDKIMQSAQAGDKNVFDVANISELISRADIDGPLEQYMSDLSTSLDRLGRIYFLMLFHGDKFAERFSQEDLPSMEESVRNTFLNLGELILKLKERKIESDSGSVVETDLNQMV